ncbi:MAG: hypothetical protein A2350_05420 [Candidatus Raymondbacteria bacterium RifOxyB12_full_50_8]|uniref:CMP/dCMP-type deaminase domain-containing protein n=1 Tax=Candidatus Raymondbacteria bacterium RIFOXYD12_FULL_49_13 TaxID=1817890 RepID=A0A1F7FHB7_UNCRA|nr:MAG: hypothetical protein A2248_05120 [Candidatus Raymondbacteria bacterium RIFOXYA2_FULL_49_16]OGJ99288.1 MAG: hypothetical protein A2350_05420 [Candidatus Raymondbacteria bacterium RifOxyB12_full_50_8]OGK05882.1 MAG: hypothetical protein A2519_04295 [Candidatus Raymondbacteria bacterium RIFOXYD12_FULL_49_13]OGP43376.1 MAG: hypothetical protein A2324_02760 [Candidatus Raymondbacteria bacterium RIFOXYB2_FULL_49_35]
MNFPRAITLVLPAWAVSFLRAARCFPTDQDKMGLAIELSRLNVTYGTGGPFGAALFRGATGTLVAVGVNRVVAETCSAAHAEMMACMLAQKRLGAFRLPAKGNYVLASSAQPCAMCAGALPWTGVRRLLFGASKKDVELCAGFDEGPLHPRWKHEFKKRGISVTGGLMRMEARAVLARYRETHGTRY